MLLYGITVVSWGLTWLGIKFQLTGVDPAVSVMYRFGLASFVLLIYCRCRGLGLCFSLQEHTSIALQGVLLFSLNYFLIYLSEQWLTSGLVAVIFSSVLFMNIVNEALLLGSPSGKVVVMGGVIGMSGILMVFWPELSGIRSTTAIFTGVGLAVLGTFFASLGMITSARNQRIGLPVIQTNALGMLYGALLMGLVAFVLGREFTIQLTASYLVSLAYLVVFGSVVGFGAYLTLLGRIGPGRAGYVTLLVPIVALLGSWAVEGYSWTWFTVVGIGLIVGGNIVVLNTRS